MVPDIGTLSENIKSCLQEGEELPLDFTKMFNDTLFEFNSFKVPNSIQLYKDLELKHEPLTLIPPSFETPMPPLKPAVFPPSIQELQAPSLELYDLDQMFATEDNRIAQITNKCVDEDLDYYLKEVGEILGIADIIAKERGCDSSEVDSKEILF